MSDLRDLLAATATRIADYREGLDEARVFPAAAPDDLAAAFAVALPDGPQHPAAVIDALVAAAEPALVATAGPRYFGFVVGGSVDAALAADLLTSAWDQPAFNGVTSPAGALAEVAAGGWLKELLCLPASATVGFVTGGQGANNVGLAAGRHHVLAAAGWDVERDGLIGAPPVRVLASVERHATIDRALRLLGLGSACVETVAADANGAIDADALAAALAEGSGGPTIVCLQAGNVNTGAVDALRPACEAAHAAGAWVHVDGAFGLWAGASPATRALVDGVELADSWAADGHKWLNVPYDSGYAFCAHPDDHVAAMSFTAAYLVGQGTPLARADYVPESSRRARGFATWAALQQLGRSGVAELVDRCCARARQFAEALSAIEGVRVVNDVVLNQVLVRFGDDDPHTDAVIDAVQRSGECWMGGTSWHGERLMRISVSNWATSEDDVDRSVTAIAKAHASA
jgi:glutamate/tyrosine decarboxylase-like PLP-dependent enzyme